MAAWRNISEINIPLKIQAALGWYDRLFSLSADIMFHYVHSWIFMRWCWSWLSPPEKFSVSGDPPPGCCAQQCCCLVISVGAAAVGMSWHCCLPRAWCWLGCSWQALPNGWVTQKGKVGGKCSAESQQRKGDAGEANRTGDLFVVTSVTICMVRCGAVAGYWSGTEEPQPCTLITPLAQSVALSNLHSPFPQLNQENNAYLPFYTTLRCPVERWHILLFINSHLFPTSCINFCSLELNIYIS